MLKSIFPLSFATFFTRMSGFLRDYLLWRSFQAGQSLDLFFLAFRFPQLMRRFFAEGSFQQALLPVIGESVKNHDEKAFTSLYQQAFWFLFFSTILTSASIWLIGPQWISKILAPGLNPSAQVQYWELLCWSAPYSIPLALISLYALILQLNHSYWLNGFSPTLMNLAILIGAYFYPGQVLPMIQAMFFMGIIQVLLQAVQARRKSQLPLFFPGWPSFPREKFREVLKRFVQLSGLSVIIFTNIAVDQRFLSYAPAGSLSIYYLCERVIEIPVGVLGYSLWSVFSTYFVRFSHHKVARIQLEHKMILLLLTMILPATAAVFCFAPEIIGSFVARQDPAYHQANFLLHLMSCEIFFIVLSKIYVIILTISHRNAEIIRIHLLGMVVNFALDALLYPYGAIGIGASTVATLCFQTFLFHTRYPFLSRLLYLPRDLIVKPLTTLLGLLIYMLALRLTIVNQDLQIWIRLPFLIAGVSFGLFQYYLVMKPFFEYLNQRVASLSEHIPQFDRQVAAQSAAHS